MNDTNHDSDLDCMTSVELKEEVIRLRNAIRLQRDQKGHDLCWYVPELWDVLPEKIKPDPEVPPWDEFIARCAAFRKTLDSV